MQRPASASAASSSVAASGARKAKAPIRAPKDDDGDDIEEVKESPKLASSQSALAVGEVSTSLASPRSLDTSTDNGPMDITELSSSASQSASAPRKLSTGRGSMYIGAHDPCSCDEYHSLRCNDKLYSMLHNQIELPAAVLHKNRAIAAQKEAQRAEMRALFGKDLPPEPKDADATDEAALRYHASDFTLGNLKNQTTRVVLPPTIVYSRTRPTEYLFTSLQTGGLLRKSKSKVHSKQILDDLLGFTRRNMADAFASLGANNSKNPLRQKSKDFAWAMEKDEFTNQIQYGSKDGSGAKSHQATTKTNLPHYMTAIRPPGKKSALSTGKAVLKSSSKVSLASTTNAPSTTQRPSSAFALPTAAKDKFQNPLSSNPRSEPAQHCDIIAQFTFASDCPRYNNPYLPYTTLTPGTVLDPHNFPDILYLNVRSLHHFLTVVNSDPMNPRATGVLQPFVPCEQDNNTVYRVSFIALDAAQHLGTHASPETLASLSARTPSLPTNFHVSIEARQNVLKLVDHSGLGPVTPDGVEFTLAERAATFDAAHLSLSIEKKGHLVGGRRGSADRGSMSNLALTNDAFSAFPNSQAAVQAHSTEKTHILYPRLPMHESHAPAADNSLRPRPPNTASNADLKSTTLVMPSGYPFSPSAYTAAQRINVPSALQARFQAAILRMVSHVNELYKMSERRAEEQLAKQEAIHRALYANATHYSPPLLPPSPSVNVAHLECFFKIDPSNNLVLLTCRSLKHLVKEQDDDFQIDSTRQQNRQPQHTIHGFVRCAQCYHVCNGVEELLSMKDRLIRPTSEVMSKADSDAQEAAAAAASTTIRAPDGREIPFYALRGGRDLDEDAARRRRDLARQNSVPARSGSAAAAGSAMVFAMSKKKKGDFDEEQGPTEEEERDLWPESHFNPPPVPADKFRVASDRIQSNPLFSSTVSPEQAARMMERNSKRDSAPTTSSSSIIPDMGMVHIRDEVDEGEDDEDDARLELDPRKKRSPRRDLRLRPAREAAELEAAAVNQLAGRMRPESAVQQRELHANRNASEVPAAGAAAQKVRYRPASAATPSVRLARTLAATSQHDISSGVSHGSGSRRSSAAADPKLPSYMQGTSASANQVGLDWVPPSTGAKSIRPASATSSGAPVPLRQASMPLQKEFRFYTPHFDGEAVATASSSGGGSSNGRKKREEMEKMAALYPDIAPALSNAKRTSRKELRDNDDRKHIMVSASRHSVDLDDSSELSVEIESQQ